MIIRIIVEGVQARREKERAQVPAARQKVPKKELVDLFAESPFQRSGDELRTLSRRLASG
jgi:hypothetical protein